MITGSRARTREPVNNDVGQDSKGRINHGGGQMLTNKCYLTEVFCRALVLILCMSLVSGCTTLKPVNLAEPQSIRSQIKPGDELQLTTRDGKVRELRLNEMTEKQLVGENEKLNISDITEIERREISTGKTLTLVVLSVLIIGILTASSSGGWSKGP